MKKNKKSLLKRIGIVIVFLVFPYIAIPALGLWWFYKKSKFSDATKSKVTKGLVGLLVIYIVWQVIAYFTDAKPYLTHLEPNGDITIQAQEITLKGTYEPIDRKVWINNKQIAASNGSFETTYQLKEGENEIEVSVGNRRTTEVNLIVTRELTEQEKAQIEAERKAQEEKEAENQTPTITEATPVLTTTPTIKPTAIPTAKPTVAPTPSQTVSQINAVKKAKAYLDYTAFSHDGLVTQLEYEQFSHADAVYGADNSGANWNEQAAKKAQQYVEYSAFSRGGLIEQLKYEKFTQEQAEYGANAVGL